MTFTEIVTEVADRLGMTATSDTTRIGRAVNRKYREITTSIGIKNTSRRSTASSVMSVGSSALSFANVEKVITIYNQNVTPYMQLKEVTLDELRAQRPYVTADYPTEWAVTEVRSDTVWVDLNARAVTGYTLYADVYVLVADLSGSGEPSFPESFHDILYHGVLVDEYMKIEKLALADFSARIVEKRMGELRLWLALSTTKDQYQGKARERSSYLPQS